MANEISLTFGSLALKDTNNITIEKVSYSERKSVKESKIPKMDGSIAEVGKRGALTINVSGDIAGSDYDDLRTNVNALKAGLQNDLQTFTTDDDLTIKAQLSSFKFEYITLRTLAKWTAKFIAHYPFWLADTATTDDRVPTSGSGYTLTNNGNAPARCKIEITAPAGGIADAIQIENTTLSQLFKYRGTVTVGNVLEVDNRYDTDDFEVLNNGADGHVDFEGDFITLGAGANTVEYTGTAGAGVKFYWKDTYY